MDIKEKYKEARFLDNKVDRLKEELEELSTVISAIDTTKDAVQTSNQSDLSDSVLKIDDVKAQIKECMAKLSEYKKDALEALDKIKNTDEYNLMFKRYIQLKSWEEISVEMHFTIRYTYKLHGKCLKKLKSA